jgi:hypothetical protein
MNVELKSGGFMKKICLGSFIYSLGAAIYIGIVALILNNSERLFGKTTNYLAPVAFLLLFTLSALVVGALLLGKPVMLYFDNKKKDAVVWLMASIGWIALFTIIFIINLALR